jgi:hypothetical protein
VRGITFLAVGPASEHRRSAVSRKNSVTARYIGLVAAPMVMKARLQTLQPARQLIRIDRPFSRSRRGMPMWVYLVALLGSAAPDPTDAKAAFDRMERQVLMCKTLRMHLEVNSGTGKDAFLAMKGRLLIAPGDKVRLELDGSMGGKPEKMALVSDGTKQRMTSTSNPAEDQDTKSLWQN